VINQSLNTFFMTLDELKAKLKKDPMSRAPQGTAEILNDDKLLIDVHCHVFNWRDVPKDFKGWFVSLFVSPKRLHLLERLAGKDRHVLHAIHQDRPRIANNLFDLYKGKKKNAIICPLTMDMSPSFDDNPKDPEYKTQLQHVTAIKDAHPGKVLPFICLNPLRAEGEMKKYFIDAFNPDGDLQYFGVKIYPSLGYFPSHPELMEIFKVCEEFNIPVTTHVSSGITRNNDKNLYNVVGTGYIEGEFVKNPGTLSDLSEEDYRLIFNNPFNWEPVLKACPKLKLNLAHFGGDIEWKTQIKEGRSSAWVQKIIELLCSEKHPNVYADFSYTFYNPKFNRELKTLMEKHPVLQKKVLYGSDSHLVLREKRGKMGVIYDNFEATMGDLFEGVSVGNGKAFLFGEG
jgi:predicted TIM-barrel fold metal-dependent hydrolase